MVRSTFPTTTSNNRKNHSSRNNNGNNTTPPTDTTRRTRMAIDARAAQRRQQQNEFQRYVFIGFVIGLICYKLLSVLFIKETHDIMIAEHAMMEYFMLNNNGINNNHNNHNNNNNNGTATATTTTAFTNSTSPLLCSSSFTSDTTTSTTNAGIPRLPVIIKPNPIPSFIEVKKWMTANKENDNDNDGNQTAGQFMLDFAILGFAKCGTSTMMKWLGDQSEIYVPDYEITDLTIGKNTYELIQKLYGYNNNDGRSDDISKIALDPKVKLRGFKSPNDIMDERPIRILRDYFPQTKIIVGIRHPIKMIESFYNHRIQNGLDMPQLQKITYTNMGGSQLVTLGRAAYSDSLIHLGKTSFTDVTERGLIHYTKRNSMKQHNIWNYTKTSNFVYIYDTTQLNDQNTTRQKQLMKDIENFLGLNIPLDIPYHFSPGKKQDDIKKQQVINSKKIKICDDQYSDVRQELITIGKRSQEWIINWFLQSPDVFVSNRDHFIEIISNYQYDPCVF